MNTLENPSLYRIVGFTEFIILSHSMRKKYKNKVYNSAKPTLPYNGDRGYLLKPPHSGGSD